ncbi:TPA: fimbrial protein [Serratia odorifera]
MSRYHAGNYIINRMDANKMKKRFLYGVSPALGIIAMLASSQLYADCILRGETVTGTVSSLAMTIQRDAPVGSVLGEQALNTLAYKVAYCAEPANIYRLITYAGGVPEGNNVYRTNLAGVGVRVLSGSISFSNPPHKVFITGPGLYTSQEVTVQFVKTGPITAGAITPRPLAKYYVVSTTDNSSVDITLINMGSGNTVTQLACSLNASNIKVPLGDVLATEFTGVGTTLKPKAFNVGLNCDANAKINVSLGGTQSAESSDSSILQLTNAGSAGVAKGVGVQLLYNNTPLKLNQLLALKTSAGGQETFPFTAHYYQTAANITAGSANATATLNISYQ